MSSSHYELSPPVVHYGGLTNANVVETTTLLAIARRLRLARRLGIGLFWSAPGLGKTTAVRHALSSMLQVPYAELTFSDSPQRRETAKCMFEALSGTRAIGNAESIELALLAECRAFDGYLVINEVEELAVTRLNLVRRLRDDSRCQTTFVFLGDGTAPTRVSADPRVSDRVGSVMEIKPLGWRAAAAYLPRFHSCYQHLSREQLHRLHDEMLHGSWRRAAKLASTIDFVLEEEGLSLDSADLTAVLEKAEALFWAG